MKKRFKHMLAMALLAAMILSGGIPALAAEDPAVESELTAGIDTSDPGAVGDAEDQASDGDPEPNPLPQDVGFNLRNVSVSRIPDSDKFTVTIIHAKKIDERGRKTKYGIAEYDMTSKKAIDIEGRTTWVYPETDGRITFKDVDKTAIILTAAPDSTTQTPADYFNTTKLEKRGVAFVMPTKNVFNLMAPVDPSDVMRYGNVAYVNNTEITREYAMFDTRAGKLVSEWEKGNGDRIIPPVVPGADPANTRTGFDDETVMATLTVDATPGFAFAIASGDDGHILSIEERYPWGITAQTESGVYVAADETNFYSAPAEGETIRFLVPPGGKYYMVTRLPDGTTARPDEPYQTQTVGYNKSSAYYRGEHELYTLVTIYPASIYSEYAVRDNVTGKMTDYERATYGQVVFRLEGKCTNLSYFGRPIPLPKTGEDTPSPGQGSPTQETMPPVLNKSLSGTGETQDGRHLTVGTWDPNNSTFVSGQAAVEDALGSAAGQQLDPQSFSGAALAGVASEPFTLIIFYDGSGTPVWALYCYDDAWYSTRLVDLGDGTYLVNFRDGIVGYIDITDLAG